MNGYVREYNNNGMGRTFILLTKHWCSNKLNNN